MENVKPKYSVIIPLYNKELYVKKALESVMSQTCKDFELIIVDDGSTDNSATICEEYLSRLSSLDSRLIRQANSGVAAARNNGVKASKGDYVAFLDADDWWEPTFLEEIDKLITEYSDAGIYCTNYVYYKPGKTHVALKLERGYMNYPEAYLHGEMPVTSISTCMPRRIFDETGGFPVGIKLGEDFLLWAKTAVHHKVAFCEKPLAYYNNDVPVTARATRNLYAPEHNMLFNLASLENEIEHSEISSQYSELWKALLDKLRVCGLLEYWLDGRYHEAAAKELQKVDWSKQLRNAKATYEKPIWFLKFKRQFMQIGSFSKQKLIRLIHYK